jgi:cyclopropane fatty-acyl-phospholipid synthase-like methyltransferase
MSSLKNWDNKTWLSSAKYIHKFNKFLLNQHKMNKDSIILDIGCGRGKILGNLSSILKLKNKPIGLDIEDHKDKDKKINFKKIDGTSFLSKTKKSYDLILVKQTIHLLTKKQITNLLLIGKKKLNLNGKIIIFSLNPNQNELPTFELMKEKLKKSLKKDKKIFNYILKSNPKTIIRKFIFKVKITKKKYIQMITKRYISTLLNFNKKQILNGVDEINYKYNNIIKFNDKLICLIIKN